MIFKRVFHPSSIFGVACLWLLAISAFGWLMWGVAVVTEKALGCSLNEGGVGACMLGPVDINVPLTMFAMMGAITAFLIAPVIAPIGVLAGVVCIARRKW